MASIRFQITREMVDRFAALTGDRSSLHVDAAFARRSPFRRRVAHGMLPVMYLSRCELWEEDRNGVRLAELSTRFLKPAFPGGDLELTWSRVDGASDEATDPDTQTYAYTIASVPSGEPITTGTFRVEPEAAGSSGEPARRADAEGAASIVAEALRERSAVFEDISKGEKASFSVRVAGSHVSMLREILSLGTNGEGGGDGPVRPIERALLYAACSSAYVGMRMPGRYATYTELTSTWTARAARGGRATFSGEVTFLSPSTQTAVAQFAVTSVDDEPLGRGRIKVRVNAPPREMPSMAEVRQTGPDLGLRDRVVLVTGASRGLGETIAKLFGAYGARVIVNYHRGQEDAGRVVDEIVEAGGRAIPARADVTDPDDVRRLVEEATRAFGSIEVLVNNAAGDYDARAFRHLSWGDVQRDLDVIVKGAFYCCQAVLPAMVERGFGRIVNLSTIAVEDPPVGHVGYVVAKSALLGLTRSLAVEFAAHGVCVNAVMPGLVETDLTSNMSDMVREAVRQGTPMKRHASPLDVARAVVYLASDWSSYTTGQQIAVTGGQPPFH